MTEPTSTDARTRALTRSLTPTRRYADAEVSRMLAAAADMFDRRGDHEHAQRLRARADELDHDTRSTT